MYSVWKNAKCLALFKTYGKAYKKFLYTCENSDKEKDCVEMYNGDYLLQFQ